MLFWEPLVHPDGGVVLGGDPCESTTEAQAAAAASAAAAAASAARAAAAADAADAADATMIAAVNTEVLPGGIASVCTCSARVGQQNEQHVHCRARAAMVRELRVKLGF